MLMTKMDNDDDEVDDGNVVEMTVFRAADTMS